MARKFDYLADVEAFMVVVEKGSMTHGAIALSTTASVLSRAITRLEKRLGIQLLRRTTRRLSLTEAGTAYLEQTRAAFALIESAERGVQGTLEPHEVAGQVRITAPTTYGHYRLPAMLEGFLRAFPNVQVEVSIINRNVDLVSEGFDLAIRQGQLRDSAMVARKLEDAALKMVAAPGYLARAGVPQTIEALGRHQLLSFVMPSTGKLGPWTLRIGDKSVDWQPQGRVQVMDDVLGCVSLAEAGIGICQTYDYIVRERLAQGRLVEVMPELSGCTRPFSLLYPPHRHLSPATRQLVGFLASQAAALQPSVSAQ